MTTRAEMLERVQKALGRPTPSGPPPGLPPLDLSGIMPPLAPQDYLAKFEAEFERVGGIPYRVKNLEELEAVFQKILVLAETHAVSLSRNPILAELGIAERLANLNKFVTAWTGGAAGVGSHTLPDYKTAAFAAGAGITGVDYVLAETGTLVMSSLTEGVQVASLAPPIHVALYRRSQLRGLLDEVVAKLPIAKSPGTASTGRSVVFVTGTSRTADIEQILIRGVHGPKEVHAILVEDSCK